MSSSSASGNGAVRTLRDWRRQLRRRLVDSDGPATLILVAITVALTAAGVLWPMSWPQMVLILPMLLGSLWLGPRKLPWFVVFALVGVCVMVGTQPLVNARTIVRIVVTFAVGLIILLTSFRRSRLGVSGPRGESMLVDLRDRISRQGEIPKLPQQWYVQAVTRSAGGTSFAGDFVVASKSPDGTSFDVVVVDVSGKGVEAGTRALLLSGAFGGLLTALAPENFLPAANTYLLRQEWVEGFATAIHLHLDLSSGDFELRKAGHPPAVWLHAGSGKWSVLDSDGPILGLIPDTTFELITGTLGTGDGLLLYTDGLVETPTRDIASGIDKLAGEGARLLQVGFDGGARGVIDRLESTNDDRALLLVHRR
jgi:hypothetical protein